MKKQYIIDLIGKLRVYIYTKKSCFINIYGTFSSHIFGFYVTR